MIQIDIYAYKVEIQGFLINMDTIEHIYEYAHIWQKSVDNVASLLDNNVRLLMNNM